MRREEEKEEEEEKMRLQLEWIEERRKEAMSADCSRASLHLSGLVEGGVLLLGISSGLREFLASLAAS